MPRETVEPLKKTVADELTQELAKKVFGVPSNIDVKKIIKEKRLLCSNH
jgi:hypothetical protein